MLNVYHVPESHVPQSHVPESQSHVHVHVHVPVPLLVTAVDQHDLETKITIIVIYYILNKISRF